MPEESAVIDSIYHSIENCARLIHRQNKNMESNPNFNSRRTANRNQYSFGSEDKFGVTTYYYPLKGTYSRVEFTFYKWLPEADRRNNYWRNWENSHINISFWFSKIKNSLNKVDLKLSNWYKEPLFIFKKVSFTYELTNIKKPRNLRENLEVEIDELLDHLGDPEKVREFQEAISHLPLQFI